MARIVRKLFIFLVIMLLSIKPACAIRICVNEGMKESYVGSSKMAIISDGKTNARLFTIKPYTAYTIRAFNDVVAIKVDGKYYSLGTNYIKVKSAEENGFLATKKKWYRGEFVVYNINKKLVMVNELPLEQYLLGVVPSEMPARWNFEAHKAQTIAARSYAIANMGKRKHSGYDLKDTPIDQAYGGASAETSQTTKAVLDTKGIVLTYDGKIIPAYYHASSGGTTKASGAVWARDLPYIKAVKAYDEGVRKSGHGVGMSQHGANNLANKGYTAYQILNYFYKDVKFSVVKTQL